MHRPVALVAAVAVAALTLLTAAPGAPAHPESPAAHAAATYRLSADSSGDLRFTRRRITASKGSVTLRLSNPSPLDHGIAIGRRKGKVVGTGGTSKVTVTLQPGTYTYYCPVDGHRARGMTGKLTVR